MEGSLAAVLGLGFILGLKHATDADHVVAVTTFVSREKSLLRSCRIGIFWGAGHTLSLAAVGAFVLLMKVAIPQWLETRLELGVAVMLVVLGGRVLYQAWRSEFSIHRHPHTHPPQGASHRSHLHWHLHSRGNLREHSGWLHDGLKPLVVGMVHGVAGSGALTLLVLSTLSSPLEGFAYILVFGVGSIAGMLTISMLLALPMRWINARVGANYQSVHVAAGVLSCLFGIYMGVEIWNS